MSGVRKITTRGYLITARANKTARYALRPLSVRAPAEVQRLDATIAKNLKEHGHGE